MPLCISGVTMKPRLQIHCLSIESNHALKTNMNYGLWFILESKKLQIQITRMYDVWRYEKVQYASNFEGYMEFCFLRATFCYIVSIPAIERIEETFRRNRYLFATTSKYHLYMTGDIGKGQKVRHHVWIIQIFSPSGASSLLTHRCWPILLRAFGMILEPYLKHKISLVRLFVQL